MPVSQEWFEKSDCGEKCKSSSCAAELNAVITKGNGLQIKEYIQSHCPSSILRYDNYGRSPLHIAASCGKTDVLDWLIATFNCDVNIQDQESGWTALHRAVYFGRLASVVLLIEHGANMWVRDKEGMTPMDISTLDCTPWARYLRFSSQTYEMPCVLSGADPSEVYTWGVNDNFVLGHGNPRGCKLPEAVDYFVKKRICIKQVAMAKFHTVFVTVSGSVYACGHGEGGRLGNGHRESCLEPTLVTLGASVSVLKAAVALNHTVFTTETGQLLVCGLNKHHVLGTNSQSDRELVPVRVYGALKTQRIVGCAAGVLHTVVWTESGAVFTFGTNAGQLGHAKVDLHVKQPRQVSGVYKEEDAIVCAHACDSATAIATKHGTVYVLQNYICRKIIKKQLNIEGVQIGGGRLDVSVLSQVDMRLHAVHSQLKDDDLHVLIRKKSGDILGWSKAHGTLDVCKFNLPQTFLFKDISLCSHGHTALFITNTGKAFIAKYGNWKASKPPRRSSQATSKGAKSYNSFLEMLSADPVQEFIIEQVSCVFRAHTGALGPKAKTGSVLQCEPRNFLTDVPLVDESELKLNTQKLWEDVSENDIVHDVIVIAKDCHGNKLISLPCHKYILASRSPFLRKMINQHFDKLTLDEKEQNIINGKSVFHKTERIIFENCDHHILKNIIEFIYCESCQLLRNGYKLPTLAKGTDSSDINIFWNEDELYSNRKTDPIEPTSESVNGNTSAFSAYQKSKNKKEHKKSGKSLSSTKNCFSEFKILAKKLGLHRPYFDTVTIQNGVITTDKKTTIPRSHFTPFGQHKFRELYDIKMECSDGKVLEGHKCILVARVEFFRSMLLSQWAETSDSVTKVPIPSDIFKHVLDFIYTDSTSVLNTSLSPETLCEVMAAADQLLINRLKEIAEMQVASLLTLKNVSSIIEFASSFHCPQLRKTCEQFICHHLPALMLTPHFYSIDYEIIEEIEDSYRSSIDDVFMRTMTPSSSAPELPEVLTDSSLFPIYEPSSPTGESTLWFGEGPSSPHKKRPSMSRKSGNRNRKKSFSRSEGITLSELLSRKDKDVDLLVERIASTGFRVSSSGKGEEVENQLPVEDIPSKKCNEKRDINDNVHNKVNEAQQATQKPEKVIPVIVKSAKTQIPNFRDIMMAEQSHLHSPIPTTINTTTQKNVNNPWGTHSATIVPNSLPKAIPSQQKFTGISPGPSGGVVIPRPKKLSQKQRRKLEQEAARHETESDNSNAIATSPPTANAWGKASSPPPASTKSFWDVMKEQSHSPKPITQRFTKPATPERPVSEMESPTSPWKQAPKSQPQQRTVRDRRDSEKQASSSFRDIMQSEVHKTETDMRRMSKPMHLIQLEDQAMAELKSYYEKSVPPIEGQFFTIERCTGSFEH